MPEPIDLGWGARSHVDVDGVRIAVETAGGAGRPVLALLHGFASGTFSWAGVAPTWADRHRVVAWDRPPFGHSDRPAPPPRGALDPYGVDAVVATARAVLDEHAGDGPLVLVGHSAGTLVATQLVLAGGFDVRGAVLIAPALAGEPPGLLRRLFALPGASAVGAAALKLGVRGARVALRRVGQHGTPLIEATGAETARSLRRPGTAEALVHLTTTWERPALLDDLGPLGVPTSVIGGIDDRISTPTATRDVADRLAAELHLLERVGHAPHEQVPGLVASLVSEFVESVVEEGGR
ncbi:MAG: alpha/beta hydrolase [Acidimicrobiales bacterium]|nr:alpha/beta hydrolase [Acidimicrobiales bacterium]